MVQSDSDTSRFEDGILNNDEKTGETSDDDSIIEPPDGGWGWLVVLGAFIINVITDGCSYSFGVLFTNLIEYFHESRSKTAWIGSVFCAVPLLCGPIASFVTNKIGYRKATILGGVITSAGFVLSYFVNSIESLCITYGAIAGLGISLPYLNSIVVVAEYFEKKRALVTGLSECGAGIGTLLFAPILERLISEYGWRGAVLIMGGVAGNIVVCGALFRPLRVKSKFVDSGQCTTPNSREPFIAEQPLTRNSNSTSIDLELETLRATENEIPKSSDLSSDSASNSSYERESSYDFCRTSQLSINFVNVPDHPSLIGGSIASLPQIIRASKSCPEVSKNIKMKYQSESQFTCPKSVIDLSVLGNPVFLVFTLSNFILYFWYDVPYVFTVDRAKEMGINERDASLMVAIIGILHTIGNILYGYLGDKEWMNRAYLYCVSMILCGASLSLVPVFTTFIPSTILAGIFGLLSAAAEALCSVIIVDILGIDKLTDAFGIMMFLQGTANLMGPPFAGWLYDIHGTYNETFWSAGSCIIVAGCVYLVVPLWKRCKKSKSFLCM
ncbi:monocarboxylate transporter 5-like [Mizuhopecten yessoensis]|uniref:Monocarboxylate transporter 5 n=1 Tax=Mizuhopecten yessoensis TaxID=6573 RepID=A0A210PN08_MIZYE|nr:monocarboxylate transporter 5-like [Mizuhopecten yessoensis]XP_021379442.1 monocarboxylate transporter 5-like [Mizuhopecten yessoensis]XP_021379443.1 monocarboxylate transporter 5-like [Mizuhopecten yessoensis]XP_021379444.1 monocarboxylate transporter 5-like [Mizuhopecten yessoensis]OWF37861.1 Monocarboxylate transporter 5 [Mizuhopecten yessoensis]